MKSSDDKDPEIFLIRPVVENTYMIDNALDMYDAIAEHSEKLNKGNKHFWGLTQTFALNYAVLGICKIYDSGNKNFKKHAVPELLEYLYENINAENAKRITENSLRNLKISEADTKTIIEKFNDPNEFENAKDLLRKKIDNVMPKKCEPPLKTLYFYRNKKLAHQEQIKAKKINQNTCHLGSK